MNYFKFLAILSLLNLSYGQDTSPVIHTSIQNVEPTSYFKDGKFKGPIIEILDRLQKDAEIKLEYQLLPWPRILKNAKDNYPSLLVRHSMNPDRRIFLMPIVLGYNNRTINFIKHKSNNTELSNYKDLYNFKIGFRRDAFYGPKVNEDRKLKKFYANTEEQLLELLKTKRIDFSISYNLDEYRSAAKRVGINFDKEYTITSFKIGLLNGRYLSFPKPLRKEFYDPYKKISCQILKYRKDGTITKIFKKYGIRPYIQDFSLRDSLEQEKFCK